MTTPRRPPDDPASVMPEVARSLAASIDAREMSGAVTARILRDVFPARADDAEFLKALDDSVHDNVQAVLDVIAGRLRISQAEPLGAIALMDLFARLGEPTRAVERGYRIGQWEIWERWVAAARARAGDDEALLITLLEEPVRTLFRYIDSILTTVLERYEEQRRDIDRARDHERTVIVRQILEGTGAAIPMGALELLRYDCLLTHRAVVIKAPGRRDAERALQRLRTALDASDALLHMDGVSDWVVWLGRREEATPTQVRAFRHEVAALDLPVGVSEAAPGIEGFRETMRQARQALRIGRALASRETWFVDVQLEALLLDDPDRAEGFVRSVLGPLAAQDDRSARLRETVAAWLEAGSHVGAAALLDVHEHTVRNRLRQAEEQLGASLPQRRTELAVALRLERIPTES